MPLPPQDCLRAFFIYLPCIYLLSQPDTFLFHNSLSEALPTKGVGWGRSGNPTSGAFLASGLLRLGFRLLEPRKEPPAPGPQQQWY